MNRKAVRTQLARVQPLLVRCKRKTKLGAIQAPSNIRGLGWC